MCRMAQNCEILIQQDTVEKAGAPMAHCIVFEHCNLRCLKIPRFVGVGLTSSLPPPDRGWLASLLTLNLVLFCQGHFLCEYLLPWPSQLRHQFCDNLDTSNGTGYLCAAAHQSQVLAYYSYCFWPNFPGGFAPSLW